MINPPQTRLLTLILFLFWFSGGESARSETECAASRPSTTGSELAGEQRFLLVPEETAVRFELESDLKSNFRDGNLSVYHLSTRRDQQPTRYS